MKKRFIAGAVCPRCGETDKLVVDLEGDSRECVSCGYADQRPSQVQSELRTRVNRPRRRQDTEEVTRFADIAPFGIEPSNKGDAWVRVGGLKGFVDGSLGSHTAAFHEGYTDGMGFVLMGSGASSASSGRSSGL